MKLKYPKIYSIDNRNKYNWDDRNIGEVEKAPAVSVPDTSGGTREADRVDPWSSVNEDVNTLMQDRTSVPAFTQWEDTLDYLMNMFNHEMFHPHLDVATFPNLELNLEESLEEDLPEIMNVKTTE